jgi:hypothetical protein
MIKQTVQGDVWYSETLGYSVLHTSKGSISLKSESKSNNVEIPNGFLSATDWVKINRHFN